MREALIQYEWQGFGSLIPVIEKHGHLHIIKLVGLSCLSLPHCLSVSLSQTSCMVIAHKLTNAISILSYIIMGVDMYVRTVLMGIPKGPVYSHTLLGGDYRAF